MSSTPFSLVTIIVVPSVLLLAFLVLANRPDHFELEFKTLVAAIRLPLGRPKD